MLTVVISIMSDPDEGLLPTSDELDTLNILCIVSIFVANAISVLYIFWSVIPVIKRTKRVSPRQSILPSTRADSSQLDSFSISSSPLQLSESPQNGSKGSN